MKVLFWGRWIDDVLLGLKPPDGIGGAEVQMTLWCYLFSIKKNDVYSFGWRWISMTKRIHGIRFIPWPWVRKIGIVIGNLRFFYRFFVDPDVIFIRSNSDLSYLIRKKKPHCKIVLMLAHDHDVEEETWKEKNGAQWLSNLEKVDLVVAQSSYQAACLRSLIPSELHVHIQPNIFFRLPSYEISEKYKCDFSWVGTLKSSKRPELFILLAERHPEYSFGMAGFGMDKDILEYVKKKSRELENFQYYGYLNYSESINFIAHSKVTVSTSMAEGFPNIFLQAWYFQIPVISYVDPNKSISKFGLGKLFTNLPDLEEAAIALMNDQNLYATFVENISSYFNEHHGAEKAYDRIIKRLQE